MLRPETIKLLEEKIGSMLFNIGLSNIFFGICLLKGYKNTQMGLHQTKKLLHSKENHQQNKKADRKSVV